MMFERRDDCPSIETLIELAYLAHCERQRRNRAILSAVLQTSLTIGGFIGAVLWWWYGA